MGGTTWDVGLEPGDLMNLSIDTIFPSSFSKMVPVLSVHLITLKAPVALGSSFELM